MRVAGDRPEQLAGSAVRLDPADLGSETAGMGLGQGQQLGAEAEGQARHRLGLGSHLTR